MSSIWKDTRTPGRPAWTIRYKGLDGKWHRERVSAQNKEQAQRVLAKRLGELAEAKLKGAQTLETARPVAFSEFVSKEYLPAMAPPARRPSTHKRDGNLFRALEPHFGGLLLGAITVQRIERYLGKRKTSKTRRGTPPSKAQLNRERQFLASVLGMAKRWGLIDRNPVEDVKRLREDNERDRALSPEEEADILAQLPSFLRPILTLAVNTGMRSGEIIGLKWADVDRRNGEAVLDGFLRIGAESAKGHRTRHVPINSAVKAVLDAERPYAGKDGFSPYVFVNPDTGRPFQLSSVSHAFQRAARRAGVEGVCFHVTRHTAVSRMVAAGIPDRLIMKIVGHSTPHMVARYSHLAPAALKGATDCLARQKAYKERTSLAPVGGAVVTS